MLSNGEQVRRWIAGLGSVILMVVILWIDIATGFWQEIVILAGVTAGLVTFVLNVLVLDRLVARSTARRWAPVTRLALTEFLHALADEERSEISRGIIHPRLLPELPTTDAQPSPDWLHELRHLVVAERSRLASVLGTWSSFLASSSENEDLLVRIANLDLRLDRVRDESLELENGSGGSTTGLATEIAAVNGHFRAITEAIEDRLETTMPPLIPVPSHKGQPTDAVAR